MIIPVRCFTCGKVIGNKYETYTRLLSQEVSEKDALDQLELRRYCCRRMVPITLLTHCFLIPSFIYLILIHSLTTHLLIQRFFPSHKPSLIHLSFSQIIFIYLLTSCLTYSPTHSPTTHSPTHSPTHSGAYSC